MTKYQEEYILCAAIHFKTDTVHVHQPENIKSGAVICGMRHHNCFQTRLMTSIPRTTEGIQGFLTNKNRFVTREQAAKIAYAAQQIDVPPTDSGKNSKLFSENLY